MFRKLACAMLVMTVAIGLVAAEEFTASITKVDGDKVTFQKFKKTEFKKPEKDKKFEFKAPEKDGDPVTLPLAKDAKILKAAFGGFGMKDKKKEGEPLEGGLKNDLFKDIGEKGRFATVTTSEDNKSITQISVFAGGKGFKDKKGEKDKKVEKDK